MIASEETLDLASIVKGLTVFMGGVKNICLLYKVTLDCCKKNYYCKIALCHFVSETSSEMLIFMPNETQKCSFVLINK